jgi:hypothetical protein
MMGAADETFLFENCMHAHSHSHTFSFIHPPLLLLPPLPLFLQSKDGNVIKVNLKKRSLNIPKLLHKILVAFMEANLCMASACLIMDCGPFCFNFYYVGFMTILYVSAFLTKAYLRMPSLIFDHTYTFTVTSIADAKLCESIDVDV